MATLIVPDSHERLGRLARILDLRSKADRTVFLGDWFDTFAAYDEGRVREVCGIIGIISGLTDDLLLGNHDCHYFFDHAGFMCSGYEQRRKDTVRRLVTPDTVNRFQLYTTVGPYLVSHAGFNEHTLQYAKPEIAADALKTAKNGGFDPIFGAGRARGGNQRYGGPTWLDWNDEFSHIDDLPQIVGHTMDSRNFKVRSKGTDAQLKSWCLDTGLRHVAWVDETTGAIEIEDVAA
jgi:hypothetical protein